MEKKKIFVHIIIILKKIKKSENLIFMTYNYVLNPAIKNKLNILESNSIVIFDEAHNICNILENINTRNINLDDFEKVQIFLQVIFDFFNKWEKNYYSNSEIEYINPLFLIDTNDINNEITKIRNFINNIKKQILI